MSGQSAAMAEDPKVLQGRRKHYVDGGVVANNPTMAAIMFGFTEDRIGKSGDIGPRPANTKVYKPCCISAYVS